MITHRSIQINTITRHFPTRKPHNSQIPHLKNILSPPKNPGAALTENKEKTLFHPRRFPFSQTRYLPVPHERTKTLNK